MTSILQQFIKSFFTRHYDKIIFLDFDGVLCPINDEIDDGKDRFGTLFNTECAKQFNYIIAATDAKIVFTSSWRQYLSLWQLRRTWRKRNMVGEIVGITPLKSTHRGEEIDYWLKKNKYCRQYVILDDMNFRQFNDHHRNKLVTCDGRVGLTAEDAIRVINIFETKINEKL
jgi:hypothetical protein